MNRIIGNMTLILCIWLSLTGVCFGKQVYLRDGGVITCKSFWQRGDTVTVKVNRDTLLEFKRQEIDLQRTFHKSGRKAHFVRPKNAAAPGPAGAAPASKVKSAVTPPPAPAAAAKQLQAAPGAAKPPSKPAASAPPAVKQAAPATVAARPVQPPVPPAGQAAAASPVPATATSTAAPLPVKPGTLPPAASPPVQVEPAAADAKADVVGSRKQAAEMMTEALRKNDPELMKKAVALQQNTLSTEERDRSAGLGLKIILILLVCALLIIVSNWVIFEKAGYAGWKCLIPIYNLYIMMEVCAKPWWWLVLLCIPLVGAAFYLMAMLTLAEKFGRGALFGVGLFILPMFFMPILAFGGSQYEA